MPILENGKISGIHFFSAYKNSNQSISAATPTKLTFNTVRYGSFDTANNRFVAPVAGYYYLSSNIRLTGSLTDLDMRLYKNNSFYLAGDQCQAAYGIDTCHLDQSFFIQLAVNDYIEIYVWTNAACTAEGASNLTSFDGFLVTG